MYINTELADRPNRPPHDARQGGIGYGGQDRTGKAPLPPPSESVCSPGGKGRAHDDDAVVSG